MTDLDGVLLDLSGPWLDLAAIEREQGNRNILTLRLDRLLEEGVLTSGGPGVYCWTDGSGVFLLGVRRAGLLTRFFNRLLRRRPVSDYWAERREFPRVPGEPTPSASRRYAAPAGQDGYPDYAAGAAASCISGQEPASWRRRLWAWVLDILLEENQVVTLFGLCGTTEAGRSTMC